MKKGFTMIELIFVIVILGILAAVAIPRLAATRDDATAAAIKTDVGTLVQAVPAWYQGQKDARILQAVSLDTSKWVQNGTNQEYQWKENGNVCISVGVYDMNISDTTTTPSVAAASDINTTNGAWKGTLDPVLRIVKGTTTTGPICTMLWSSMGLSEQNISMGGQKVQW